MKEKIKMTYFSIKNVACLEMMAVLLVKTRRFFFSPSFERMEKQLMTKQLINDSVSLVYHF